jgi:hypothetical protein
LDDAGSAKAYVAASVPNLFALALVMNVL